MSIDSKDPLVSVVVLNYNGRHHLEQCLPSLRETSAVDFETIVVDNGSDDGSVEWLEENYPELQVLPLSENLGFGEANRRATEIARGRYIAFLNNDTIVTPGWLEELLRVYEREGNVGAVCSFLLFADYPDIVNGCGGGMTRLGFGHCRGQGVPSEIYPARQVPEVEECLYPTAAAMLIERSLFLEMGGFDREFFMYHEDVDLGWRLWLSGRRVLVCKRSVVYHREGGTTKVSQGAHWSESLGARHDIRSIIKNYEFTNMLRALPTLVAVWIYNRRLKMLIKAWIWNLARLPSTLRERSSIQSSRQIRDRELFDRRLIDRCRFPVMPPAFPVRGVEWGTDNWMESDILLIAYDSALGRLGFGWYAQENISGRRARRTWLTAAAYLRSIPGASGVLRVSLFNPGRDPQRLHIHSGPQTSTCDLPGRKWSEIKIDADVPSDGVLRIYIVCSDLSSPKLEPSTGVYVDRIEFNDSGQQSAKPDSVAVVIPTFNRADALQETLIALSEQTRMPDQVVVVDDGSSDRTPDLLAEMLESGKSPFSLTVLHQANSGPAAARNRGIAECDSDLIIFLGDDTIPSPDLIEQHLKVHGQFPAYIGVVGYTDWHESAGNDTPFLAHINRSGDQFGYGLMKDGEDVPFTCLYTSNLSIPSCLISENGFDEWFRNAGWEDVELGYRLSVRGMRLIYSRAAVTRHMHPMTLSKFIQRQYVMGGIYEAMLKRHPELARHFGAKRGVFSKVAATLMPLLVPLGALCTFLDSRRVPMPKIVYRLLLMWSYHAGMESPPEYGDEPRMI